MLGFIKRIYQESRIHNSKQIVVAPWSQIDGCASLNHNIFTGQQVLIRYGTITHLKP